MSISPGDFSDPAQILLSRRFHNDIVDIQFDINLLRESRVIIKGKGSIEGSKKMLEFLQEAIDVIGEGNTTKIWIDLRENDGAPLRAQMMFGKWFTKNRRYIGPAALVGAGAVERKIANFVLKIARFSHVRFFKAEELEAAHRWLYEEMP